MGMRNFESTYLARVFIYLGNGLKSCTYKNICRLLQRFNTQIVPWLLFILYIGVFLENIKYVYKKNSR